MAGSKEIRTKIKSVQNTRKITKAMEMVSAAKLRRSQGRVTAGRPFADKLGEVLGRLVASIRASEGESLSHPLLEAREVKRVLYVAMAAERGLAGGYNANVIRQLGAILDEETRAVEVIVLGRKLRDYVRQRGITPFDEYLFLGDEIEFALAKEIAGKLMELFQSGEFDEINLIYTEFVSAMSQRPVVAKLLPIDDPGGKAAGEEESESEVAIDYLYEPSKKQVIDILLPRYVETQVYRAMMEAKTSEHAARMTAMRSASDNAGEMIEALTLSFNRARQASITKEISEIVGGAAAISGE